MTRFVLDKNPELDNDQNLSNFIKILESNTLNLIMHSDAFLKTIFLNKLILATKYPVIYLDFDLLFSGYIISNIITQSKETTLYQPNTNELLQTIKKILVEISQKKSILIIDSLNGLLNLYHDNKDAGRLVNSYIMLFYSIAKNSNSCVLISGMTRRKNNEEWVLSITGRHVFETKQMNTIQLERKNSSIIANILDEKALPKKSYEIPIQSELI
jgi:hypothetical protein